jgi:hypothetical protein
VYFLDVPRQSDVASVSAVVSILLLLLVHVPACLTSMTSLLLRQWTIDIPSVASVSTFTLLASFLVLVSLLWLVPTHDATSNGCFWMFS